MLLSSLPVPVGYTLSFTSRSVLKQGRRCGVTTRVSCHEHSGKSIEQPPQGQFALLKETVSGKQPEGGEATLIRE